MAGGGRDLAAADSDFPAWEGWPEARGGWHGNFQRQSALEGFGSILRIFSRRQRRRNWRESPNGIGGYASGTIVGGMTRRYHGLLIAALRPPVGRMHLVAALDEFVRCGGEEFALATHLWASGAVEPTGFQHIEGFLLDGTTPVWTYAFSNARLEKRVWMQQGMNTT